MTAPATAAPATRADASDAPFVLLDRPERGVALVTLNRPDARNALSLGMMGALRSKVGELARDDTTAVIVIAGSGPAFCAGHDLKELTSHRTDPDGGRGFYAETMAECTALMLDIVTCPKPVIAAVGGIATAAGCQLVATCDLAVAAMDAKFCTPGVNIGLFCSTPMVALSRNVPRKRAMEMLLLGDMLSAAQASDYGLVNRVAASAEVVPEAMSLARRIAEKPVQTVAIGKRAFYEQADLPLGEAYAYAANVMVENMMIADAREGIAAFLEKRPANWGPAGRP